MGDVTDSVARDREAFVGRTGVSRETLADLDRYAALLLQWQKSINLVSASTLPDIWSRHFMDSWQLLSLMPEALHWTDLGSGAGFPGAVIAIALKHRVGAKVSMIESNGKKAAFLQTVVRETKSPATIITGRIEHKLAGSGTIDVITARALAPLVQLIEWSEPHLNTGATGLFSKGRDVDNELRDAAIYWDMDYTIIPSLVESGSCIVKITSATLLRR